MIQKLEEDVALLGSCLLSVPRPSQTHPSQQCMQPARFRNYAGNSPKGKQGKQDKQRKQGKQKGSVYSQTGLPRFRPALCRQVTSTLILGTSAGNSLLL
jgi:hypothetical protein